MSDKEPTPVLDTEISIEAVILFAVLFTFVINTIEIFTVNDNIQDIQRYVLSVQNDVISVSQSVKQINDTISMPKCEDVAQAEKDFCQKILVCTQADCNNLGNDREVCIKILKINKDEWIARCRPDCAFESSGCTVNFHLQQDALLECYR